MISRFHKSTSKAIISMLWLKALFIYADNWDTVFMIHFFKKRIVINRETIQKTKKIIFKIKEKIWKFESMVMFPLYLFFSNQVEFALYVSIEWVLSKEFKTRYFEDYFSRKRKKKLKVWLLLI